MAKDGESVSQQFGLHQSFAHMSELQLEEMVSRPVGPLDWTDSTIQSNREGARLELQRRAQQESETSQ